MHNLTKRFAFSTLLSIVCAIAAQAEETTSPPLPFDRALINRYSLDHLPRSISIRQGDDQWLGFDLQRAKLYKAWQAPPGEPGLKASGFVMRSVGQTWYEDKSEETWRLQRSGEAVPMEIRYLGCSQRETHFELTWRLSHGSQIVMLRERIPMTGEDRVVREVQADSLPPGTQLLLPPPTQKGWSLETAQGQPAASLSDTQWYRLISR